MATGETVKTAGAVISSYGDFGSVVLFSPHEPRMRQKVNKAQSRLDTAVTLWKLVSILAKSIGWRDVVLDSRSDRPHTADVPLAPQQLFHRPFMIPNLI